MTTPPPSRDPLVAPATPPMSPLVRRPPVPPPEELPVLSNRAILWVAVVLIVLGAGLAVGLLLAVGDGKHTAQLDAIKTAGTIVLGTGGAVALWLTARRQRTSELSLRQAYAAHAATVADAEARRITDLFGKAADQLGSTQATVRLAGLYALERLAQDNPAQRQTIVDLLCAYLRMPYEPVRPPAARRPGVTRPLLSGTARQRLSVRPPPAPPSGASMEVEQEHQVRRTAQGILFRHLLVGDEEDPVDTFWSGINLDLTGAVLGPANLIGCRVVAADFTGATFTGDVWFSGARFGLDAVFTGVRFAGEASFSEARFDHSARFDGVVFDGWARFRKAEFGGTARFGDVRFGAGTEFTAATFADQAWFDDTVFVGQAEFDRAKFVGRSVFGGAHFADNAYFARAEFRANAHFHEARFAGTYNRFTHAHLANADFRTTEFGHDTDFTDARFTGVAAFDQARFTGHADFVEATFGDRVTFDGTRFAGYADFTDSRFDGATRFDDCHFGRLTKFRNARFGAAVDVEGTEFGEGAGFGDATFGGRALFARTTFAGVCGFPGTHFADAVTFEDVRFDGPVGFTETELSRPPRLRTVWVRVDRQRPDMAGTWPEGTRIREIEGHPDGVTEGRWALLVTAPPDEEAAERE